MIKEQIFISRGKEMIFRKTCTDKSIGYEEIMHNDEGYLFELELHTAGQLFYLGREYQINLMHYESKTGN